MKKLLVLLVALAVSMPALAGSISRGGASFSRPSVSSTPARSIGMSRPAAAPSYSAPAPSTAPRYAASTPTVTHAAAPSAPSVGSTFLSSMGGSFAGSLLGSSLGSHSGGGTTVVNAGGVAPVAGGGAVMAAAPVAAAPSPAGFMWSLVSIVLAVIVLGAIALGVYALVRSFRREKSMSTPQELPFSPVSRFLEVQKAFAARDAQALRVLLGPDLVDQMLDDLPEEATEPKLKGVRYEMVEAAGKVISIRYQARDEMDDTDLDEVWHFCRIGNAWALNGIDVPKAA